MIRHVHGELLSKPGHSGEGGMVYVFVIIAIGITLLPFSTADATLTQRSIGLNICVNGR
jgi:hypothetical protein